MLQVIEKSKCCGCGSCANICPKQCISMVLDEEGFLYPAVDGAACVHCGLCESVCPVNHKVQIENSPLAYAVWNTDEQMRRESSSGGMFTLFAEAVLGRGGVVFGARFDEQFQVVHDYAENVEDISVFRGSKYLQSRIGGTYQKAKWFLDQGRLVLFTGTPCQVAGLLAYLNKEYENLICVDIVCHGVPSAQVWDRYVTHLEKQMASHMRNMTFRDKTFGWKKYRLVVEFANDEKYACTYYDDEYMKAFLADICLRPSCYNCAFKGIHRESDITLADFWGIENVCPEMYDDRGTSLLITNSEKGAQLFEEVRKDVCCRQVDLEQASRYNPAMIRSAIPHRNRKRFLANLEREKFDELVEKYCKANPLEIFFSKTIHFAKAVLRKIVGVLLGKTFSQGKKEGHIDEQ